MRVRAYKYKLSHELPLKELIPEDFPYPYHPDKPGIMNHNVVAVISLASFHGYACVFMLLGVVNSHSVHNRLHFGPSGHDSSHLVEPRLPKRYLPPVGVGLKRLR